MRKKAYILGAGPIGLITGWKLLENGWTVDIYEKENIVGGMCRTWKWGEFLVDTGPHIYHTPDKELALFWEDEFGDLFVKGEFWCKNVSGKNFDEYWDYPLSWESISRYPSDLKKKILNEVSLLDSEKRANAKNYTEYMEAQVGPTLRRMFFQTYPEKIWGIPTNEMTPDWAPKRIEFRQKVAPFYHNEWNAVGKYGTGCIYERIRDNILKLGGQLFLDSKVKNIISDGNHLKRIEFLGREPVELTPEDFVISSLPITSLAAFLGYESKLSFRGTCSVYLAFQRSFILPKGIHWLYYGSEDIYFNRITEPKKLSPFVAPEEQTYLTSEITYSKGDEVDKMNPQDLMQHVAEQVEKVGLAKKEEVIDCGSNKEDFVYPIHYMGYQEELAKTRSIVSRFQQLYSVGTGGDFNYADSQVLFHKAFDTVAILCEKESSYTQVIRQTPQCVLNKSITINNRKVGKGEPAYIIAEAGLNHNGSLKLAKQLVDAAIEAGCDAVKFQTYNSNKRISSKVKAVRYAEKIIGTEETMFEMFKRLELSQDDQRELFAYAREKGVEIFSTPFDFESVDFLESLDIGVYKIASMDLLNLPLIKYIAEKGKPVMLSTGMSTYGQVEEAVEVVKQAGNPNLILLHCNSSYPASLDEMNLKVIETLKKAFNVPVGLSDHTFGLFASHTAIVMGTDVIERHFTLDKMLEGPDHIMSSDPEEFAELVDISLKISTVLGDGIKRIQPSEYETINIQRKSLYASRNIEKGTIITEDMIDIKGPGGGLLPKYLPVVIGRMAKELIEADHPINWQVV